jgi:hypothetical protein
MQFAALLVLAAGGWFFAAAMLQYSDYTWAAQTCSGVPVFCNSPYLMLIVAVAVAAAFFIAAWISEPS